MTALRPSEPDGPELRVRPYALTGGRTRARTEVSIETIVVLTPAGAERAERMPLQKGDILRLCRQPQSVAEISARLRLPLGVARVLAGDLCHDGLLAFNRAHVVDERPDVRLLERVFDGLQAL